MVFGLFLKRKYSSLLSCLLGFSLLFLFHGTAHAFLKKSKIKKTAPQTDVSEPFPYRIFFTLEPATDSKPSQPGGWVELNYKLVNGADVPGPLFQNAPGGKVRFLDKDGFVLASDFFLNEDFQKTDFYSSLLVERKRAGSIVTADALPLREGELEILQKERLEKAERRKKEEEIFQVALGHPSEPQVSAPPSPASEPLPKESVAPKAPASEAAPSVIKAVVIKEEKTVASVTPAPNPSQEAVKGPQIIVQQAASEKGEAGINEKPVVESTKIISEPSPAQEGSPAAVKGADLQNQVTASSAPVKIPASAPDKKKDLLDLGGTTNEEIEKTLSVMDKKPATKIEESPSTIPGISFEDGGADASQS